LADVKKDVSLGYEKAMSKLEELEKKLKSHSHFLDSIAVKGKEKNLKLKSNTSVNGFVEMVKDAKKYISSGDIIQTVLSQRFEVGVSVDPLEVYRHLRIVNPSPYMFYLNLDKIKLVGASPEVMVKITDGKGCINPIAGTRPRGATDEEDIELEKELLASEKEKAEHLMLVDLSRNDLGRVCEFGTVKTSELMHIERYSHVMHIVSCVEGNIKKGIDSIDVLRASFPAGTVSGAPKVRAMEIIDELEKSRRGPYAGCVGYLSFNGDIDTCITIRTILFKGKKAYIQVGAGIVADSSPKKEYEETVNKAKGMLKAISLSL
jgi:anthranilate synthase component 1